MSEDPEETPSNLVADFVSMLSNIVGRNQLPKGIHGKAEKFLGHHATLSDMFRFITRDKDANINDAIQTHIIDRGGRQELKEVVKYKADTLLPESVVKSIGNIIEMVSKMFEPLISKANELKEKISGALPPKDAEADAGSDTVDDGIAGSIKPKSRGRGAA